MNSQHMIFLD